jgi:proline dehydrogenase
MSSMSRRVLFALATSERFERLVRALPGGEQLAFRRALRYVGGRGREDAFALARRLAAEGIASSIDLFGENVSGAGEADRVAGMYVELARALPQAPPGTFLSLDLSHIGIDEPGVAPRRRLERIAEVLPAGARIQIGAEQAERADRIIEAVLSVARAGLPVSATAQANLKRTPADASRLAEAGVPIRLVKGAYAEDAAVAHAWGEPTDLAFVELAHELDRGGAALALGTHDRVLREALLHSLHDIGVEMLLGVRPADAHGLAARNVPVRIYIPYGPGWFRYTMRRLAESRRP